MDVDAAFPVKPRINPTCRSWAGDVSLIVRHQPPTALTPSPLSEPRPVFFTPGPIALQTDVWDVVRRTPLQRKTTLAQFKLRKIYLTGSGL